MLKTIQDVKSRLGIGSFKLVWEVFDKKVVKDLEAKHNIRENAKRDGSQEQPPSDAEGLSNTENEILNEANNHYSNIVQKARDFFEECEIIVGILRNNITSPNYNIILNTIKSADEDANHDYEIDKDHRTKKIKEEENKRDQFKRYHELIRAAEPYTQASFVGSISIIIGLLFF